MVPIFVTMHAYILRTVCQNGLQNKGFSRNGHPIYAEVIFVQFMTLQEKKILASIIEIQKENWE